MESKKQQLSLGIIRPSFTLIELLVTIAVIGILASIGGVRLKGFQEKSRNTERISEVKSLQTAMEKYYLANGKYPYPTLPGNCTQCRVAASNTVDTSCQANFDNSWTGLQVFLKPYLYPLPKDPQWKAFTPPAHDQLPNYAVIVSSPDDNSQHYLIISSLEATGADALLSQSGVIGGVIKRQPIVYGNPAGATWGSITYHSSSLAQSGTLGGGVLTCGQDGLTSPYNGSLYLYCGKMDYTTGGTGGNFPNGTYYNYCVGNIFKLPRTTTPVDPPPACINMGWFETRAETAPSGSNCYMG